MQCLPLCLQAYEELKTTDKAKDMREQQLLLSQMQLAYKTGDREKVGWVFVLLDLVLRRRMLAASTDAAGLQEG